MLTDDPNDPRLGRGFDVIHFAHFGRVKAAINVAKFCRRCGRRKWTINGRKKGLCKC